jgi:hypothetical protein
MSKIRAGLPPTLERTDIVRTVNVSWQHLFDRVATNKRAIAARGWVPLNYILLDNPELQEKKDRVQSTCEIYARQAREGVDITDLTSLNKEHKLDQKTIISSLILPYLVDRGSLLLSLCGLLSGRVCHFTFFLTTLVVFCTVNMPCSITLVGVFSLNVSFFCNLGRHSHWIIVSLLIYEWRACSGRTTGTIWHHK